MNHKIVYHPNGCKYYEWFIDKNGCYHNINAPAYQEWFDNIYNPSRIGYSRIGKIGWKDYYISDMRHNKLNWMNKIKKCW